MAENWWKLQFCSVKDRFSEWNETPSLLKDVSMKYVNSIIETDRITQRDKSASYSESNADLSLDNFKIDYTSKFSCGPHTDK